MSKSKKSGRRQAAVLEALFAGERNEQEILDQHHIDPDTYARWLADPHFAARFEQRVARAHHEARLILARHAPRAARKLADLANADQGETTRKACLDILALPAPADPCPAPDRHPARAPARSAGELPAELASRLLAALAQEGRGRTDNDREQSIHTP